VIIVALLGGGAYLLYRYVISPGREAAPREAAVEAPSQPVAQEAVEQFVMQDEAVTRWFNLEDTIAMPLNGNSYRIQLIAIDRGLTVRVPGGTLDMTIGQDRQMDLNADGRNDLRILLNDVDATEAAKRVNLSLYKITKASVASTAESASQQLPESAEVEGPETAEVAAGFPESTAASQPVGASTILSADSPSPFRVSISFRGYCLFRYLVDNNIREERFFHKGESFALDVKNEVLLWISNAGVVRLMVAGREIEVGRPGAVTTKQIRWSQDDSTGQYLLQAVTAE
jgi:cytoskeleton protein RodZ